MRQIYSKAGRVGEAIESLRARRGDAHANLTSSAAHVVLQLSTMHSMIHSSTRPPQYDAIAQVLCTALSALQVNLVNLLHAAEVDIEDTEMLVKLLAADVDDAIAKARADLSGHGESA
jgi:hypothetical protein